MNTPTPHDPREPDAVPSWGHRREEGNAVPAVAWMPPMQSKRFILWQHLHDEHKIIALESELDEIIDKAKACPEWKPDAVPADVEDDVADRFRCDRCGGDGFIEYNDGDGSDWGEDCPSEINHLIPCRACRGTGEAK